MPVDLGQPYLLCTRSCNKEPSGRFLSQLGVPSSLSNLTHNAIRVHYYHVTMLTNDSRYSVVETTACIALSNLDHQSVYMLYLTLKHTILENQQLSEK